MDPTQAYLKKQRQMSLDLLTDFIDREFSQIDTDTNATDFLEAIADYLVTGGKFGRPLLAKLAYAYVSSEPINDAIAVASLSVELLHRFILVHDDIIDGDKNRHGQPTLETLFGQERFINRDQSPWWGRSMAMVAGDIIHSLVDQSVLATSLAPDIKAQVVKGLHHCLVQTALGWRLETKLKTLPLSQVDLHDVEKAMMLVSGEYSVRWPLRIGQLLAGSQWRWNSALEGYGLHIGLAFQMQDDILGLFGDPKLTGKPVGGDIRESKKTHLLMHAYAHANAKQRNILESVLGSDIDAEQLAEVKHLFEASGALAFARGEMERHLELGLRALDSSPNNEASSKLAALARYLCSRDH